MPKNQVKVFIWGQEWLTESNSFVAAGGCTSVFGTSISAVGAWDAGIAFLSSWAVNCVSERTWLQFKAIMSPIISWSCQGNRTRTWKVAKQSVIFWLCLAIPTLMASRFLYLCRRGQSLHFTASSVIHSIALGDKSAVYQIFHVRPNNDHIL